MAEVQPFCGLRYDVGRIGSLSSVISPPYDVISPREQQVYLKQSPYNVIRLELGEEKPSDSPQNNQYTRAANILRSWIDEGILFRDRYPALYIFEHRFPYEGTTRSRWGLNARVRLEDWSTGWVRPHEHTFVDRIGDRLKLLRFCNANVSPIMGMFRHEPEGLLSLLSGLATSTPDSSALDYQGITHNMWIVRDKKSIARVTDWCADKVIYIADGHHRYETALAYQREQRAAFPQCTGKEPFNFVMMTIMDAGDPGVIMLPTHRLVQLTESKDLIGLRGELSRFFHLEYYDPPGVTSAETIRVWQDVLEERSKTSVAIGVYGLDGNRFCLLMQREGMNLQDMMPPERGQLWKDLDVAILHEIILRRLISIDTPEKKEECLDYTQDWIEAFNRVNSGEYQLAFFMSPVPVSRVMTIADDGDRMPQKYTYFYPKLPTGLVIHPLWDEL